MNKEITLVYSIGIALAVLFGLGYWLDQRLNTGFIFTVTGAVLGVAYIIWEIVKLVKKSDQKHD